MINISPDIKNLIEQNAIAIATVDEMGDPHCITVVFVKVVSKNQLLVTNNYMVKTIENIQRKPSIALAVWDKNWEEKCVGYELKGTTEYFTDGKWREMVKNLPGNKGEPCKGAILVTINRIKKLA